MHQWKTVNDFDLFMIHLIHKYLHKFLYNKIKDMEVKFIIYNMSVYIRLLISKNLNLADNFQSLQNRDIEENQRCSAWYETIMLASFKLIPLVSSLKFVRTTVHTKECVCVCVSSLQLKETEYSVLISSRGIASRSAWNRPTNPIYASFIRHEALEPTGRPRNFPNYFAAHLCLNWVDLISGRRTREVSHNGVTRNLWRSNFSYLRAAFLMLTKFAAALFPPPPSFETLILIPRISFFRQK